MCSANEAVTILHRVYDECKDIMGKHIEEAFLYGSYARGDYSEDSDIDILITSDINPESISEFRKPIAEVSSKLSLEHDVTVSITIKSSDQFYSFANILPFYKNVIKEGIRYAG